MQDPSWNDTIDYIFSAWRRGDWPWATYIGLLLIVTSVRIVVSLVWQRHKRDQQIATLRSVFGRWANSLEQPFWTLSTPTQLAEIERLGDALMGNHEMVLALLVGLRVQFETIPVDDAVLQAVDRLAAQWQDKLPSARRRRYRMERGIEAEVGAALNRRP